MKLPEVEYEAPTTVAGALDLLAEHGDEASVLAGGQSLIPLLALRLARPAVLIDINGVDELAGVSQTDGQVAIGATTREYVAEESPTASSTSTSTCTGTRTCPWRDAAASRVTTPTTRS
jgi:carbon-monoxide dehydrogenase medium subunit